jgi:hypothetical protein
MGGGRCAIVHTYLGMAVPPTQSFAGREWEKALGPCHVGDGGIASNEQCGSCSFEIHDFGITTAFHVSIPN